jgi:hypothetical protein
MMAIADILCKNKMFDAYNYRRNLNKGDFMNAKTKDAVNELIMEIQGKKYVDWDEKLIKEVYTLIKEWPDGN